jgi:hypothetical protein
MSKQYTVDIQENADGELILPLPEEMLKEVGWKEGDDLNWEDNKDGSYTLTKVVKSELEWVLVDAVSSFRMRYMVQVPKGKKEYALDTVTCEDAKEFSQEHLGEHIVSHRVVSEAEALELCDLDNDYTKSWDADLKQKTFFTFWDEQDVK